MSSHPTPTSSLFTPSSSPCLPLLFLISPPLISSSVFSSLSSSHSHLHSSSFRISPLLLLSHFVSFHLTSYCLLSSHFISSLHVYSRLFICPFLSLISSLLPLSLFSSLLSFEFNSVHRLSPLLFCPRYLSLVLSSDFISSVLLFSPLFISPTPPFSFHFLSFHLLYVCFHSSIYLSIPLSPLISSPLHLSLFFFLLFSFLLSSRADTAEPCYVKKKRGQSTRKLFTLLVRAQPFLLLPCLTDVSSNAYPHVSPSDHTAPGLLLSFSVSPVHTPDTSIHYTVRQ